MHNENWDDLRFVLAVAETGSVLQAAKQLGVNHATVLRRISAYESRIGAPVFERTTSGYRLLPDQHHTIRAAKAAKAAMDEVTRLASGGRAVLHGTVKVTSTDTLCSEILPAFVARLRTEGQTVDVSLLSSNSHLDLLREEAQISLRPAAALQQALCTRR